MTDAKVEELRRASNSQADPSLTLTGQAPADAGGVRDGIPSAILERMVAILDPGAENPRDRLWWMGSNSVVKAMRIYQKVIVPLLREQAHDR